MRFEIQPLTPDRWRDFVTLFSQRGPRGGHRNTPAYGCWCMWWRDRALPHGEPKKRAMQKIVRAGREPGLLAYDRGEPVGWVAVAPREEFSVILRSPQYRPHDEDEDVWAITCFTIDKPHRGRGVTSALLDAAVKYAFAHGASAVEAYAHKTDAGDYMGWLDLYLRHGFEPVREKSKRTIVRRARSRARGRATRRSA